MRQPRVAFIGFGEVNTPREIILRKCAEAQKQLSAEGVEVAAVEPVSDDPQGNDVARARKQIAAAEEVDAIVLCVAGWIPSHAVINAIDPFRHKPMVLWGLSGWREGGRWITTADQAGTSALRRPMQDMGLRFKYVADRLGGPSEAGKVAGFARAARAAAMLRDARIGTMGYRDMRLYATLHDGVSLRRVIGPDVEGMEMLEVSQIMDALPADEVSRAVEEVRNRWTFTKPPAPGTIEKSVRLAMAVRWKVRERSFDAVTLIDVDGVKKFLKFAPAGAFMLLHEWEDICTIPENDVMGSVTQLMTRFVLEQVAGYMEFYEFTQNGVLVGVPDYVPPQIVDGPVTVMPTAFGGFGEGLLNVSKVRTGAVTLARLGCADGRHFMHIVTGNASAPRPWEEAGWSPPAPQLPSLEIALDGDVEQFAQTVLGQHYILSYGRNVETLIDLCRILGVEVL